MNLKIELSEDVDLKELLGYCDQNLKLIEDHVNIQITLRENILILKGSKVSVETGARLINDFLGIIRSKGQLKKQEVLSCIKHHLKSNTGDMKKIYTDKIEILSKHQYVTPKTNGQKEYVDSIRKADIVFGIGPAGTGKSYLAMAMAVNALKQKEVLRIILTRPAVEAGEKLGFLPGDLYQKVNPYLRPLYDALYDMMEVNQIKDYIEKGVIEIAPLAYMRGRTLNDSFIILDEAQNSTPDQMKMFLTRLGFESKTVITGDITQSDLPTGKESGLEQVQRILKKVEGIKFVYFSGDDVVRHPLVQEIVEAYDQDNTKTK